MSFAFLRPPHPFPLFADAPAAGDTNEPTKREKKNPKCHFWTWIERGMWDDSARREFEDYFGKWKGVLLSKKSTQDVPINKWVYAKRSQMYKCLRVARKNDINIKTAKPPTSCRTQANVFILRHPMTNSHSSIGCESSWLFSQPQRRRAPFFWGEMLLTSTKTTRFIHARKTNGTEQTHGMQRTRPSHWHGDKKNGRWWQNCNWWEPLGRERSLIPRRWMQRGSNYTKQMHRMQA